MSLIPMVGRLGIQSITKKTNRWNQIRVLSCARMACPCTSIICVSSCTRLGLRRRGSDMVLSLEICFLQRCVVMMCCLQVLILWAGVVLAICDDGCEAVDGCVCAEWILEVCTGLLLCDGWVLCCVYAQGALHRRMVYSFVFMLVFRCCVPSLARF